MSGPKAPTDCTTIKMGSTVAARRSLGAFATIVAGAHGGPPTDQKRTTRCVRGNTAQTFSSDDGGSLCRRDRKGAIWSARAADAERQAATGAREPRKRRLTIYFQTYLRLALGTRSRRRGRVRGAPTARVRWGQVSRGALAQSSSRVEVGASLLQFLWRG